MSNYELEIELRLMQEIGNKLNRYNALKTTEFPWILTTDKDNIHQHSIKEYHPDTDGEIANAKKVIVHGSMKEIDDFMFGRI
jgi:hypothetical protein